MAYRTANDCITSWVKLVIWPQYFTLSKDILYRVVCVMTGLVLPQRYKQSSCCDVDRFTERLPAGGKVSTTNSYGSVFSFTPSIRSCKQANTKGYWNIREQFILLEIIVNQYDFLSSVEHKTGHFEDYTGCSFTCKYNKWWLELSSFRNEANTP